jgi:hypothetical protein
MPDNESSSSENVQEAPVNCWQYSRDVYLIGRSLKMRRFTDAEREAVITFIIAMAGTRPAYVPYINLKADNPPANEFAEAASGEEGESSSSEESRELVWDKLEKQNDYSLAKMVQKIGRSLKVQFCTAEEKELCDALFEATNAKLKEEESSSSSEGDSSSSEEPIQWRRHQRYDVDPAIYETAEESSASSEPVESSSSEPVESSSSEPVEDSSSSEEP